jgi:hypothetical protein
MGALVLLALLPGQGPSYSKEIRPFLARYCSECHTGPDAEGGLEVGSVRQLLAGGKRGPAIVPGKPDEGPLVRMAEGKLKPVMPPKKAPQPPREEVARLRAWVLAGAKDDGGGKTVLPPLAPKGKPEPPVLALAMRPDGKLLAAGSRGRALLFNPATLLDEGSAAAEGRVTALAFSADGKLAVASGNPGEVRVGGKVALRDDDVIQALAWSPDGKRLAAASYARVIRLWVDGKPGPVLKDHSDSVYAVSWSPDGKLLASAGADRAVKVWDADTGARLYTLSESTDWVYAAAWSPDGKHLAAAGVDRSIRVWQAGREGGKVVHSVFAHEGPVLHLAWTKDGKSLFSVGEDRVLKRWDAGRMAESKVYEARKELPHSLAVTPDGTRAFLGLHDGSLEALDTATGKVLGQLLPLKARPAGLRFPAAAEKEPNNSRGEAQLVKLPATIEGASDRAGDVDWYAFDVQAGDEVGIHATAPAGSKLEAVLTLTDEAGQVLAESLDGVLGYRAAKAGRLALRLRDREYRGGEGFSYRMDLGPVPVVTAVFPLGVPRGVTTEVELFGANLGPGRTVKVTPPKDAAPGSTVALSLPGVAPVGKLSVVVGEFPEVRSGELPVPGTANGLLAKPGSTGVWKIRAKKGERLVIETHASRLGSPIDPVLEILDEAGRPLPRAVLRSLARTYSVFRDHDSRGSGIRIEAWNELAVNDYILVGSQLLRIRALPRNPDDDCQFFAEQGQRLGYLGTTPTHVSQGSAMYKVSVHPPGAKFPPNGLPLVTLFWRNDDGGPGYGSDARLIFDPPADGIYQVRVSDARGEGSPAHAYRLTARPPRPDFRVSFKPTAPSVEPGGAAPVDVEVQRLDGFEGAVEVELRGLPPGFTAPKSTIGPLDNGTSLALYAEPGAKLPAKPPALSVLARAVLGGKAAERTASGGAVTLAKGGDLRTTTEQAEVALRPGGEARVTVVIERRNGFAGRVPLEVRGLPHGVRVLDVGLNGILILPGETKRTFTLACEPWVQAMEHPIVVISRREGKPGEFAARAVMLKVTAEK